MSTLENLNNITESSFNQSETFAQNIETKQNTNGGAGSNGDIIGSASDYILIAMIVAMMFCMTICCLCLFCRSASRFTICGFNFEMNNSTSAIAPEDLSELHEVVPLTPTTAAGGNSQLPDIENILRSDPPPPRYSDVATSSMRDRFKWRSKRKGRHNDEVKRKESLKTLKTESGRGKPRQSRGSRFSFQRSLSHQPPRQSRTISDERKVNKKTSRIASFNIRRLPQSASEGAMESAAKTLPAHVTPGDVTDHVITADVKCVKADGRSYEDDDEVFM